MLVAIIGRPNVGKSSLFNAFVGNRKAIVSDTPGTTRDSLMAKIHGDKLDYWLLDTAGLTNAKGEALEQEIQRQVHLTKENADLILFLVDGKAELTSDDRDIVDQLRKSKTPFLFVANKVDDGDPSRTLELAETGFGLPLCVSAKNFTGVWELQEEIEKKLEEAGGKKKEDEGEIEAESSALLTPSIAIIGRPNVGKSSLVNKLLGQDRLVVSDTAGTTRDSIDVEIKDEDGQTFTLIDTAGLRRKGKVKEDIEYWSTVRSAQSIDRADVCLVLLDSLDGATHQDMALMGQVIKAGKGLIIGVNKFDLVQEKSRAEEETDDRELAGVTQWGEDLDKIRQKYLDYLAQRISFCPWAPVLFFSAKTGKGISEITTSAKGILQEREKRIETSALNQFLPEILYNHVSPSVGNKIGKMKYVSQVDVCPPKFVFFVNNAKAFHFTYRRYVERKIREKYGFYGTPIKLEFRDQMEYKQKKNSRGKSRRELSKD